jgi:predicted permease
MRPFLRRLLYWIRFRSFDAELAEEIEVHRAMQQEQLERSGLPAADAVAASRRALGNVTLAREDARGVWIAPWIESIGRDIAHALRSLRKQPGFTLIALPVLALAIGINTSIVTLFNAVALQRWPVKDPGRVVNVFSRPTGAFTGSVGGFGIAEYRYFAEHARSFAGMFVARPDRIGLGFEEFGQRTRCVFASASYFRVLGVEMERGRGFLPEEDRVDAPESVVVLSHKLWKNRFAGDPEIVGKQIRIDVLPFTVVGVAAAEFTGTTGGEDLWIPLAALAVLRSHDPSTRDLLLKPDYCCSGVAGRLAPGYTREEARAELEILSRQFHSQFALDPRGVLLSGTSFLEDPSSKRGILPTFMLMFAGVTLVLLLACANVGNLLVARAAARRREIAIRLSLGASRRRLIRQLLTESFVLAAAAAGIGIALAFVLPSFVMQRIGQVATFAVRPDGVVLAYAVGLAGFACVAFGLAPALHATRGDITGALKEALQLPGLRLSLRSLLLSVQVALSIVLLVGAGLLLHGVQRARTQSPGFAVADVAVVSFEMPARAYSPDRSRAFFRELLLELQSVREIEPVAMATREPLPNAYEFTGFVLPGQDEKQRRPVMILSASPGYFDLLRIPIVAGRAFERDEQGRISALVNETLARRHWPGENPVGKTFLLNGRPREIVGVVKDTNSVYIDRIEPLVYLPLEAPSSARVLVPAAGNASEIVRAAVARRDLRVRVQITPLSENLERALAPSRAGAQLAGVLGGFALVLATVGMFGVFAYVVEQRTREIGIRMALGALPHQVVGIVLRSSSRALVAGLAVGIGAAVGASRLLESRLFGVSPLDPIAYGAVMLLLAAAAAAATLLPARRAARIDPIRALRHE